MVIIMSYVNPTIKNEFETLPIELKNAILAKDATINSMADLIRVLEDISNEGE